MPRDFVPCEYSERELTNPVTDETVQRCQVIECFEGVHLATHGRLFTMSLDSHAYHLDTDLDDTRGRATCSTRSTRPWPTWSSLCQPSVPEASAPQRSGCWAWRPHEQPISADMAQSPSRPSIHMLDAWSVERLLTWTRPRYVLLLVAGQGDVHLGPRHWRDRRQPTSRHPAPVRLEIALLNIGGSPAQEWPVHILTQEEWERDVWFKDLGSQLRRGGLLRRYAALQRAALLSCAIARLDAHLAPLAGAQPLCELG